MRCCELCLLPFGEGRAMPIDCSTLVGVRIACCASIVPCCGNLSNGANAAIRHEVGADVERADLCHRRRVGHIDDLDDAGVGGGDVRLVAGLVVGDVLGRVRIPSAGLVVTARVWEKAR